MGRSDRQINVGKLISIALTFLLRIAWTFPTVFIASLANLRHLSRSVPWVAQLIAQHPWLVQVGAVGAPQLLLVLNSALPIILECISYFELPLSHSVLVASLFPKLASFMVRGNDGSNGTVSNNSTCSTVPQRQIIQTFFVTALSGSIWAELGRILTNSAHFLDFLGRALPGQSIFFMQASLKFTIFEFDAHFLLTHFGVRARRYCWSKRLSTYHSSS